MPKASLLTIFLIVFIDLMGFGIVLPNLQLYGHDFGINNYFVLALIGATYSFFQFLFAPLLGKWSDRIGRRPVLLVSQAGTLVGFLILYLAHFYEGVGPGGGHRHQHAVRFPRPRRDHRWKHLHCLGLHRGYHNA